MQKIDRDAEAIVEVALLTNHNANVDTSMLVRANLSSARKELAEVLPRLTDEMLGWAPADGMRTIQGQLVEIMATEQQILQRILGERSPTFEEIEKSLWEQKSIAALTAKLHETREATLNRLDSMSESQLCALSDVPDWLDVNPAPVAELFRYIARHEAYHTGQIVSYLWARGDDPYKWA